MLPERQYNINLTLTKNQAYRLWKGSIDKLIQVENSPEFKSIELEYIVKAYRDVEQIMWDAFQEIDIQEEYDGR